MSNMDQYRAYSYITTSASSNSGFAGVNTTVEWNQQYTVYQPAQFQQQWFTWNDAVQQPITEESRRIMDGWDPDENKESA